MILLERIGFGNVDLCWFFCEVERVGIVGGVVLVADRKGQETRTDLSRMRRMTHVGEIPTNLTNFVRRGLPRKACIRLGSKGMSVFRFINTLRKLTQPGKAGLIRFLPRLTIPHIDQSLGGKIRDCKFASSGW